MKAPLVFCGRTPSGNPIIGGAFQMADTYGFPLSCFADECAKNGGVCCYPHYFASALENGWTWGRAVLGLREAMVDGGNYHDFQAVFELILKLFNQFHWRNPNASLPELGRIVREYLEECGK